MTDAPRFTHLDRPTMVMRPVETPTATPFSSRTDFYNSLDPETQAHLSDREVRNRIHELNPDLSDWAKHRTTGPDGRVYSWSEIDNGYQDRYQKGEVSQVEMFDWTMARVMAMVSDSVTRNHLDPTTGFIEGEKTSLQIAIYGIRDSLHPTAEETLYRITDEFVQ